jgi:hypothetical protein
MSVSLSENGYTIKGIAPPDLKDRPEFAPTFWGWVVALGLKAKDRDLSMGLDKDGKPLRAITAETRRHRRSAMTPTGKGDPSAPPLMPGRQLSRTRSLLTGRAYLDRAEFWWRFDAWTGDSWARVLDAQKRRGRDVFGLSPQAQKRVQAQAWQLWGRLKAGRPIPALPLPSAAVAAGPVVAPSTRPRGGMTIAEIERHYRAPAASIPGRPGANVLLRHVFGVPEGPAKAAGGGVVPRPPKPKPIERQRVAMQPQPKPEPPKAAPVLSLPQFAAAVRRAAESVPLSMRWAENKVWIIDAYDVFVRSQPMGLTEFKRRLIEANQARLVTLARADMPQALSKAHFVKQEESEVSQGPAVFHWIRVSGA